MVSLVRRSSSAKGKTVTCTRDELVQIACDESGYEGEKLIGRMTDVCGHAGVRLDVESATTCMQELRHRIRLRLPSRRRTISSARSIAR
jgi:hypothetical protein